MTAAAGFSALTLLFSILTFQIGFSYLAFGNPKKYVLFLKWLEVSTALACIFLVIQGSEWVRFIRFSFTPSFQTRNGFFYLFIGLYGLSLLTAFGALLGMKYHANHGRYFVETLTVQQCRIIWFFLAGFWPIFYFFLHS
jgi:heme/copper-type cytochrome/quinol oxidase subunit 3